jgi:hypothetical protein
MATMSRCVHGTEPCMHGTEPCVHELCVHGTEPCMYGTSRVVLIAGGEGGLIGCLDFLI